MKRSRFVKKLVIVNGMEKGELTKALNGEPTGTEIYV